jgi:hypothetical protein
MYFIAWPHINIGRRYITNLFSVVLICVLSLMVSHAGASDDNLTPIYTINLSSSTKSVDLNLYENVKLGIPLEYQIYTTTYYDRSIMWHRLRLGFFSSLNEAKQIKSKILKHFPKSWITEASIGELELFSNETMPMNIVKVVDDRTKTENTEAEIITPALSVSADEITEKRHARLMEQARQAMAKGEYSLASSLYTTVLQHSDSQYYKDALEYLALSRERKGQLAHAKAEYEKYLTLYPEGEGSARVRQRLAALLTSTMPVPKKKQPEKKKKQTTTVNTYGSFSQYYRRDESKLNNNKGITNQSLLSNDLSFTGRIRNSSYDVRTQFTGGFDYDFLNGGEGDNRMTSLYLDVTDKKRDFSGRVGRQSSSSGGVLGRFDGALMRYQLSQHSRINLVTGYTVDSSSNASLDKEKKFTGLSVDLGTYRNVWDFNTFIIKQEVNSIEDRKAIGGEVRYFENNRSVFGLVDYDISYKVLNTFLVMGNWTLADKTTLFFMLDQRRSPLLTTSNALQGQPASNINELLNIFTEDEIRDFANDRSSDNQSYMLGASHPLSQDMQVSADVSMSKLSGTPASGGIPSTEGTGNEYFYNLQLIINNLIKKRDTSILSLRYSDTNTNATTQLSMNTRYPVTNNIRVNPKIKFDHREFNQESGDELGISPAIKISYRWRKRYHFELESGGEWSSRQLTNTKDKTVSYYIYMGYRADF